MSNLSAIPPDKLQTLLDIRANGHAVLLCQITKVSWPDGARYYTCAPYDRMPEFAGAAAVFGGGPVAFETRLTASNASIEGFSAYVSELSHSVDVEESKVPIELSNLDGAIEDLYLEHGWGERVDIFFYFPQADLLVNRWWGFLDSSMAPGEPIFKATASSAASLRTGLRQLPDHARYPVCPFLFPPENPEIFNNADGTSNHTSRARNPCQYDPANGVGAYQTGTTEFSDCDHSSTACALRFPSDVATHTLPYGGFDAVNVNDGIPFAQDSRTIDQTRGNSDSESEPILAIFGHRICKNITIDQVTVQVNNDHPERGSISITGIPSVGTISSISNIQINNIPVDSSNSQIRLGMPRQAPTGDIPAVPLPNYSNHAVILAVQKGDFRGATAASVTLRAELQGLSIVPVYSNATTFSLTYSQDPAWCGLYGYTNTWWGLGVDVNLFYIQDWLALSSYFNDTINYQDASGNTFSTNRSTFNAEWRGRKAQDQLRDWALYRRVSLPFGFEGNIRVIPLTRETLDQDVPVFTDRFVDPVTGAELNTFRNILPGGDGSSSATWSETPIDQQVNRIIANFDDESLLDMATRPLLFEDRTAQRKAGKAAENNSLLRIEKQHFLTGITNFGQAVWLGNILLDLGEFDEGGLVNPVSGSFRTTILDALTLHPYKVIQVDSYKFDKMKAKYGFKYFRVIKMRQNSDLTVDVTIQAYPDAYYASLEAATTKSGGLIIGPPTGGGGGTGPGGPAGGPGNGPKPVKIALPTIDDDGLTFVLQLL